MAREQQTKESEDYEIRAAHDRSNREVGIIGAGHIGQALARTALRAGRKVVIANSRGPETLAPMVARLAPEFWLGRFARPRHIRW